MKTKALINKLKKLIEETPEALDQPVKLWIDVNGVSKSIVVDLKSVSWCGPDYSPVLIGKISQENLWS